MTFPESVTIITDEISQDIETVARFVQEFGLPGIELRSLSGRAFKDLGAEDIAAVQKMKASHGWRIFGCSTPVFKCAIDDPAAIREHLELFKRSLDVARSLDCDLLRVFTFLRHGDPSISTVADQIAEHLICLLELSEGSGVRVGVENEASCLVCSPSEVAAITNRIADSNLGVIWDPCNVLYIPEFELAQARSFSAFADRLFHVHVKDSVRGSRPGQAHPATAAPVGMGDVDWRSQLRSLKQASYRGMVSLETHWRIEGIDENLLHLPAGHTFSAGGEAASRVCLRNLQALFGNI